MTSNQKLDQLVKGANNSSPPPSSSPSSSSSPDPGTSLSPSPPPDDFSPSHPQSQPAPSSQSGLDPLLSLPSSPPQIYLNLLILEASLRAQYLSLRERRRQYTFFLLLLAAWIVYFFYVLFFRPREDGNGVGGSIYWMVEMGEKVALMGGIVTALLVWGTGQWERGIRWPRRWLSVTNRGLRNMNTKIIVIRGPWWKELLSYLVFLFPFFPSPAGNFCYVDRHLLDKRGGGGGGGGRHHHHHHQQQQQQHHLHPSHHQQQHDAESGLVEEDLNPGGNYIRLLLLPKSFSPEFRENWDDYRVNFWEKENERRALIREKLRERERQSAQRDGGFLWWFGLWRILRRGKHTGAATAATAVGEKSNQTTRNRRRSSVPKPIPEAKHSSSNRRNSTFSESGSRNSSSSRSLVEEPAAEESPPFRGGRSSARTTLHPSSASAPLSEHSPRSRSKRGFFDAGISPLTQAQTREASLEDPWNDVKKSDTL